MNFNNTNKIQSPIKIDNYNKKARSATLASLEAPSPTPRTTTNSDVIIKETPSPQPKK